jgi:hypothetical protein
MGVEEDKEIDEVFKSSLISGVYPLIKKLVEENGGYNFLLAKKSEKGHNWLVLSDILYAANYANTPIINDLIDDFGLSRHNFVLSTEFAMIDWYIYYALRDGVEAVDMQDVINRNVCDRFDNLCQFLAAENPPANNLIDFIIYRLAGIKILLLFSRANARYRAKKGGG